MSHLAESLTSLEQLKSLCGSDQSHLLSHWQSLSQSQRQGLADQISQVDFDGIRREMGSQERTLDWGKLSQSALPPSAVRLADTTPQDRLKAIDQGELAIASGKVAMVLVAGGQGTRLGFDLPKGMYPIGPISGRTLFQMHVDSLRGAMRRFGVSIPLLVMTGPSTHEPTIRYFQENGNLGLKPHELIIFQQGTMPAIDATTGKILMESTSSIALSPDGHGGIVMALSKTGWLDQAQGQGIEHLFYAQVDNPLVRACDPLLIGLHRLGQSQATTQVVEKRFATEKVGNVVNLDGKTQIIEYSDLPEEVAKQTNPDGSLRIWAGNIAVHVFDIEFLNRSCQSRDALPFHRAHKAVPYVDDQGKECIPSGPNAIKLERFVFDLLPAADRALVVEARASEAFAPVKNAIGSPTDSPETCKAALVDLHRRWLTDAGVKLDEGCLVEIHPNWAWDEHEVQTRLDKPTQIHADTYFT
ncbi:MAG: UTP--glucose-1-phosphate uridylyltransferase [Pirellula sp.]